MGRYLRYLIIYISILLPLAVRAERAREIADSLFRELAVASSPGDSVPIMCNLYDLLPRKSSTDIGFRLVETADRAGDSGTALDIIRNQANRYLRSDSMLEVLRNRAVRFSESNDVRETLTFIDMMQNMRRARYSDRTERNAALKEYLEKVTLNPPADIYEHVALLHGICMMLSQEPNGEMLGNYLDSLSVLVNRLPRNAYSIRNAFGIHAASAYLLTSPEKSMAADHAMLKDIARLEGYYHEKGRIYRNYAPSYYTIYTRLLSNFAILDTATVKEYYDKAVSYTQTDSDVRNTYQRFPAPEIYLAMSKKDYAAALPLLKKYHDVPGSVFRHRTMLRYLIEAADAMGDNQALLDASRKYTAILEQELEDFSCGTSRELQIAYAVYNMRSEHGEAEIEKKESIASMQRTVIMVSSIAIIVLAVMLVVLFSFYRRNRQLVKHLARSNKSLKIESENLRQSRAESIRARDLAQKANNLKSDFIKNMSYEVKVPLQAITEYSHLIADCAGADGKKHLTEFANLVELNSELLSTIINDVLRLAEIDSSSMPVQEQVVNIGLLCRATLDSVRHRVSPGVELELDGSAGHIDMFTDPLRVQQILNNMLTNAAKFTTKGRIILSYKMIDDDSKLEISVTDTGIGINPENKEKIFERFVKLDRDTQGAGLGLSISRLIARLLGGDVTLDTSYMDGARFKLILPKK